MRLVSIKNSQEFVPTNMFVVFLFHRSCLHTTPFCAVIWSSENAFSDRSTSQRNRLSWLTSENLGCIHKLVSIDGLMLEACRRDDVTTKERCSDMWVGRSGLKSIPRPDQMPLPSCNLPSLPPIFLLRLHIWWHMVSKIHWSKLALLVSSMKWTLLRNATKYEPPVVPFPR